MKQEWVPRQSIHRTTPHKRGEKVNGTRAVDAFEGTVCFHELSRRWHITKHIRKGHLNRNDVWVDKEQRTKKNPWRMNKYTLYRSVTTERENHMLRKGSSCSEPAICHWRWKELCFKRVSNKLFSLDHLERYRDQQQSFLAPVLFGMLWTYRYSVSNGRIIFK